MPCQCTRIACHDKCLRRVWAAQRESAGTTARMPEACPQCRSFIPNDYVLRVWALDSALVCPDQRPQRMAQFGKRPFTRITLVGGWGTTRETRQITDTRRLEAATVLQQFFGDHCAVMCEFYSPIRKSIKFSSLTNTSDASFRPTLDAYLFTFEQTHRELVRLLAGLRTHGVVLESLEAGTIRFAHEYLDCIWHAYRQIHGRA